MSGISEQALIAEAQQRLVKLHPDLPAESVAAAVQEAVARFMGCRIREFVPLLVERRARKELASPLRRLAAS